MTQSLKDLTQYNLREKKIQRWSFVMKALHLQLEGHWSLHRLTWFFFLLFFRVSNKCSWYWRTRDIKQGHRLALHLDWGKTLVLRSHTHQFCLPCGEDIHTSFATTEGKNWFSSRWVSSNFITLSLSTDFWAFFFFSRMSTWATSPARIRLTSFVRPNSLVCNLATKAGFYHDL